MKNKVLPIRLVLAVQDEQYIEPFLHYVRCSEFDRRLIVTAFSRREAFVEYMENCSESVDCVLGEALFLEDLENRAKRVVCIYLDHGGIERGHDNEHMLTKYQPLQHLLTSILNIVRGSSGESVKNKGRALVIGVYSTVGGCGKTTVALNLVRQLAIEGRSVFYLNLETIRSRALLDGIESGRQDRKGLAELLYDLKAAKDRNEFLQLPVSAYAYKDSTLQGDTFDLPDNLDEMLEMEQEDTEELIDYIVNSGKYDVVIVDVDSCPNARTTMVLERADRVVWLVTDNKDVIRKTECWLNYLERSLPGEFSTLMGKTRFVVNRYSGTVPMETPRKGVQLEMTLPYIPAWNQGARKESLIHSAIYQHDVMKLCCDLYGDNNG